MDTDNKYGMYDMHVELLKMLFDFNTICEENGITYSLGFGSMLGAVRDHGIIPWDDDIDILMDRDNYRKLERVLDTSPLYVLERNNPKVLWLPRFRNKDKWKREQDYELTIDVFLIDHVPNSRWLAKIKLLAVFALQGMIKGKLTLSKGNCILKIASLVTYVLGRFIPLSVKFWLYDRTAMLTNKRNTESCACYNSEYIYVGRRYDGRLLTETIKTNFDGQKIPVSKYFDSYLTTLYGDYMTPPPQQKRIPKHS